MEGIYARPRVIRGTRVELLPLLPSGPGGVRSRPLHEARSLTTFHANSFSGGPTVFGSRAKAKLHNFEDSARHVLESEWMPGAVKIALSLLTALALLGPFDCFAAGQGPFPSQQKMDCCLKGKCAPKASSDDCCKAGAPRQDQLAPKTVDHKPAVSALIEVAVVPPVPGLPATRVTPPASHPPPLSSSIPASLPLLI